MKLLIGLLFVFVGSFASAYVVEVPGEGVLPLPLAQLQTAARSCGIAHTRSNGQDCFQYPQSSGALCYDKACGCFVVNGDAGCMVTCRDPNCQ